MQFFTIAALFASAFAAPVAEIEARQDAQICPSGLYSTLVCANVDVLGVLCLDAVTPSQTPQDSNNFKQICSKTGRQARCAVLPVAGQAVLCQPPVGITA
ncbi:related to trihydrophobin precursor [Ramularia collo-cygni]|uniref:Related to trihydrophobin n=1 Tax=Ramularia collo-cygni TaxID=112498 RepID=A0A2D3V7M1_9PEZI|nr:related to trihydrophobin precursor [Ramularia collo-cygni]CZT21430.1 related to trihydrophobin precursor [Ramularia collo-cygni]